MHVLDEKMANQISFGKRKAPDTRVDRCLALSNASGQ